MTENRNTILAIILSGLVLLDWQYFYNVPQMEKQRAAQVAQTQTTKPAQESGAAPPSGTAPAPAANAPANNQPASATPVSRDSASQNRNSPPLGQHFVKRRARRRPVADAVPRDRRSQLAADRAVFPLGYRESLLCGIRLGRRQRLDGADSRPEHGLAAGKHGQPDAEPTGDAEIRQRRWADLPAYHCDR